ncbi:MAG: ThuA domain-containing protein [Verrucomicrobiota bacterium]
MITKLIGFRFFCASLALIVATFLSASCKISQAATTKSSIRVVVWDERQPEQKTAYGDFLGNTIADYLAKKPGLTVKSVGLQDPEQGLSEATLDQCDVLVWWGHQRHGEVTDAHVKAVVDRLQAGKLSLVALHSAHWSKPFIEAMNLRSIDDALKTVPKADRNKVKVVTIPSPGGIPKADAPLTPSSKQIKADDGSATLTVQLPRCVFPIVRNEGKPSRIVTLVPKHPIARDVPATFEIPQTEVYAGPFHVPKPDAVIFEEHWGDKESFTSGCAWQIGKGRVFYFRPGHETYAIFKQEIPMKIVENAVHWVHDGR